MSREIFSDDEFINALKRVKIKETEESELVENKGRHQLSKEKSFNNKINRIFIKKVLLKKRIVRISRIAIILLCIFIGNEFFMDRSANARNLASIRYMIVKNKDFSDLKLQDDREEKKPYPKYIKDEYEPSYIPKGYKYFENSSSSLNNSIFYQNKEGEYIIYQQVLLDSSIGVNQNNGEFEKIYKGEKIYYCYSNDKSKVVVWSTEEYTYMLSGGVSLKTLIKMGESVKIK